MELIAPEIPGCAAPAAAAAPVGAVP